jgi:hypothetical protein
MIVRLTFKKPGDKPFEIEYQGVLSYEIIEEDKKIEKLPVTNYATQVELYYDYTKKINELVDAVNKLKEAQKKQNSKEVI